MPSLPEIKEDKEINLRHFKDQVMTKINFYLIFILTSFFFLGCSSSPVLYPNKKFQSVGKGVAEADVEYCMALAEDHLKRSESERVLKSAGKGAIVGGAVGGAAGLLSGNPLKGIAYGAAIGGVGAGAVEGVSPDQLKRRFVNRCLSEKGYEVMGWN